MTTFSWLYGPDPEGHTCKHCGDPINPAIKRQRWDVENKTYIYLDREVCDECRRIHPVVDGPEAVESSSESPSRSLPFLPTTVQTYLAQVFGAGPR